MGFLRLLKEAFKAKGRCVITGIKVYDGENGILLDSFSSRAVSFKGLKKKLEEQDE